MYPRPLPRGSHEVPPGRWILILTKDTYVIWWKYTDRRQSGYGDWDEVDRVACFQAANLVIDSDRKRYTATFVNNGSVASSAVIVPKKH